MTLLELIKKNFINLKNQIVVSGKFKHSDHGYKYFIGYKEGEFVKSLGIALPQMPGYINYFENWVKTCIL